ASAVAGTVDPSVGTPRHDLDPHDLLDLESLGTRTPDPDIDTGDHDDSSADTDSTDPDSVEFDTDDHDLFDGPIDIELVTSETVEPTALFPDDGPMWDDL
ncbi:MAG: hypothetical protein RLZZ01_1209, partial [Actinomycetota bacterium]